MSQTINSARFQVKDQILRLVVPRPVDYLLVPERSRVQHCHDRLRDYISEHNLPAFDWSNSEVGWIISGAGIDQATACAITGEDYGFTRLDD